VSPSQKPTAEQELTPASASAVSAVTGTTSSKKTAKADTTTSGIK